jgi:hypothetical protein
MGCPQGGLLGTIYLQIPMVYSTVSRNTSQKLQFKVKNNSLQGSYLNYSFKNEDPYMSEYLMSESKKCNANWNKLDTKDYIVYSFI